MKKTGKIMAAALSVALALSCPFSSMATKSGLTDAKNKKTALEAEKKKTEQTLKDLEGLKSDTTAYVKKLDSSLESIGNELSKLNDNIDAKEKEIDTTKQELDEAKETEKSQYESMKLRIKYMYEKGDSSYVDLLMESGSLSELLSKAEYISKISSYDRQKLDEYAATKEMIAEKEKTLEGEHAELLTLQDETEAKQASVEKLLAAKQTELQNYEVKIASAEGQISEYAKSIADQENQIKSIEAEIKRKEEEARKKAEEEAKRKAAEAAAKKKAEAAKNTTSTYKTVSIGDISFTWPCPSSGRVTSGFGSRKSPTKGASSNHQGIDISAPTGSSIVAAAAGQVVIATYSSSAGNYVMISHGGGVYTVYMHASSLLVSQGQSVKKGQAIAKVGSTGYSTGSHLHFGVRVNGSYVNPSKYVSP